MLDTLLKVLMIVNIVLIIATVAVIILTWDTSMVLIRLILMEIK
jgi:hypothetical protein